VQSGRKWDFPRIILLKKNSWTKSTDQWTVPAWSTMDRRPLSCVGAHQSSASGRSGARELRPRGGGRRGKQGGPNSVLTEARNAAERWRDDGEGGGGGVEGPEKATRGGRRMRANQNFLTELDLYLKIDPTSLSSSSAKTA
jgi:hypothetical protein